MEYRSPVTLLITSTGMVFPAFVPVATPKSMVFPFWAVMVRPFIVQDMPPPMSKVTVTSLPLMLSKISPGTVVVPFIST